MKFATKICNTLLHTLKYLLQIRRKMQTKCIDFYMHLFNVTHLITYCLLTYYFSFWFLLNIL